MRMIGSACVLFCFFLLFQNSALSQIFSPVYEFESYSIPADNENFLGDNIDIDTGTLSFYTVDVSIPGNSNLPVQFGRRLNDNYSFQYSAMGNWRFDVPQIVGVGHSGTCQDPWRTTVKAGRELNFSDDFDPPTWNWDVQSHSVSILNQNSNPDPYYLIGIRIQNFYSNSDPLTISTPLASNPYPANASFASRGGWVLRCVNDNYTIATAPNGTKYHFNVDGVITHSTQPQLTQL